MTDLLKRTGSHVIRLQNEYQGLLRCNLSFLTVVSGNYIIHLDIFQLFFFAFSTPLVVVWGRDFYFKGMIF